MKNTPNQRKDNRMVKLVNDIQYRGKKYQIYGNNKHNKLVTTNFRFHFLRFKYINKSKIEFIRLWTFEK